MKYSEDEYPLQKETYKIIGICMEVHLILGKGLLEIVYKDAIEYEFKKNEILYEGEEKYEVEYKGKMDNVDSYMNLIMTDAEELHDGKVIANYGRVIVRGNNVLFIKLENEL